MLILAATLIAAALALVLGERHFSRRAQGQRRIARRLNSTLL